MVAKTPLKEKRMAMALNPNIVRETVKKVDRCMARLQELQYTVAGGAKEVSGIRLSPRSTRGYLRTSLRCKQENLRINAAGRKSPLGKLQGSTNSTGEWRRMSLPAMLLGETVVEILQASQFAKDIVAAAATMRPNPRKATNDPKTPDATARRRSSKKVHCESTELRARRTKEKQSRARHANSPPLPRARSRITFKPNSPLRNVSAGRAAVAANRVSPKNRPWAKKTVLFPNPLFLSSSSPTSTRPKKFYKTRSPIIGRTAQPKTPPPHKFLVKSPSTSLRSQFKSKKAVPAPVVFSPIEKKVAAKARRCSFSPSKLASRLVSPLKSRISFQRSSGGMMSGLKQRPNSNFSTPLKKKKTSF